MGASERPALSVVVAVVSDTTQRRSNAQHLAACLEALSRQADAPALEVIVPHDGRVEGLEALRERFPRVSFLHIADLSCARGRGHSREHHDVLRARGVAAARGDIVGLIEDHGRPDEHWGAAVMAAHRTDYAAIGGAIENAVDHPLNWAVYYCDFGKYQNPLPAGESPSASDANVTYKRAALEAIRPVWEESFREVVVHGALASRGDKVALHPDIIVHQARHGLGLAAALRERYVWGRSYAAMRSTLLGDRTRMLYAILSPLLPVVLTVRLVRTAWSRQRHLGKLLAAFPLVLVLVAAWSIGEGVGYLTARPGRAATGQR